MANPYLNKTMPELLAMQKELQDNPVHKNPGWFIGKSCWIYTKTARKRMENIAWAITYLLKEARIKGILEGVE